VTLTWKVTPRKSLILQMKQHFENQGFAFTDDTDYIECTEKTQIALPFKIFLVQKGQLSGIKGTNQEFQWWSFTNDLAAQNHDDEADGLDEGDDGWGGV